MQVDLQEDLFQKKRSQNLPELDDRTSKRFHIYRAQTVHNSYKFSYLISKGAPYQFDNRRVPSKLDPLDGEIYKYVCICNNLSS